MKRILAAAFILSTFASSSFGVNETYITFKTGNGRPTTYLLQSVSNSAVTANEFDTGTIVEDKRQWQPFLVTHKITSNATSLAGLAAGGTRDIDISVYLPHTRGKTDPIYVIHLTGATIESAPGSANQVEMLQIRFTGVFWTLIKPTGRETARWRGPWGW